MTDTPTNVTNTGDFGGEYLIEGTLSGAAPLAYPDAELVRDAVEHAVAAAEPHVSGEHGVYFTVPEGYKVARYDTREDETPEVERVGTYQFVGVASLARYVNRYKSSDSLVYVADLNGAGVATLRKPSTVVQAVLNDHPVSELTDVATGAAAVTRTVTGRLVGGHRDHRALLLLKPTAAALRWGAVLGQPIDQEQLLDLVVDGRAEIARPDAAELRDLVSDLHAIRTAEVKSVVRTGGEGRIEVSENVKLHAGHGAEVTFPEQIDVVFFPFAGIDARISMEVRVKADARNNKVVFTLTAPDLDDHLAVIIDRVAADVVEQTELPAMWVPRLDS